MPELKPVTYSIDEVARLLGVGRNTCYEAAHSGQLPIIRIGGRILVSRVALENMLSAGVSDLIAKGNGGDLG